MYAREKIRPKLHQLDQEKLSRLYADLRRESLATGSFPITVRHLESMIRMSEASAKMSLREYVRSDDIDVAIRVTVASFVSTQKMSIKKTLERVSRCSLASPNPPRRIHDDLTLRRTARAFENTFTKRRIPRNCSLFFSEDLSKTKSVITILFVTKNPSRSKFSSALLKIERKSSRSMMSDRFCRQDCLPPVSLFLFFSIQHNKGDAESQRCNYRQSAIGSRLPTADCRASALTNARLVKN